MKCLSRSGSLSTGEGGGRGHGFAFNMNNILFIGGLGTTELLIIVLVVLLLFGGKKIPELMHGMGKGVRSFKEGMNEVNENLKMEEKKEGKEDK